jgi:Outer membrane protein beta-barrel domain
MKTRMLSHLASSTATLCIMLFLQQSLSFAQPQAGRFMVGGAALAGYNSSVQDITFFNGQPGQSSRTVSLNTWFFNASLAPNIGYFLSQNFVVGTQLTLGYGSSSRQNFNPDGSVNTLDPLLTFSAGLSPFARYFFPDIGSKVYPFAEASVGLRYVNTFFAGVTSWQIQYGGSVGVGIAFFVNPNVSIEPILRYNLNLLRAGVIPGNIRTNALNFGVGFQIYL